MTSVTLPQILIDVLCGDEVPWPGTLEAQVGVAASEDAWIDQILEASKAEGVQPLLHYRLSESPARFSWPAKLLQQLEREYKNQVALTMVTARELNDIDECLTRAGIPFLVMKGLPLAYSLYPAPELRPHCDVDILIRECDRARASQEVRKLGYTPIPGIQGDLISYQQCFERHGSGQLQHLLDLHWKPTNSQSYAQRLGWDELFQFGMKVPGMPVAASVPNEAYSLLLACIHRVAHHHEENDILWLYDIHLLANGRSAEWFASFQNLAGRKQAEAATALGILQARTFFRTVLPEGMIESWQSSIPKDSPSLEFVAATRWWGTELLFEIRALPSTAERLRLLRQYAIPSKDYMLHKYSGHSALELPLLHLHRLIKGLPKLFGKRV